MEKKFRKNDLILIISLLVIGLGSYFAMNLFQMANTINAQAVVKVDGQVYGRFPLAVNTEEKIELLGEAYNVLVIENGKADIVEASCPDGICVNHRPISKNGQSIVCLPNKVVVEIENGQESEVDTIAN